MRQIHIFYLTFVLGSQFFFVTVVRLTFFRNNNKNNFVIISVQIYTNLHKYSNNAMSNDGLRIEKIDQSHGDYTVSGKKFGFRGPLMMEKIGNWIFPLKTGFRISYSIGPKVSANMGFGSHIRPKPK